MELSVRNLKIMASLSRDIFGEVSDTDVYTQRIIRLAKTFTSLTDQHDRERIALAENAMYNALVMILWYKQMTVGLEGGLPTNEKFEEDFIKELRFECDKCVAGLFPETEKDAHDELVEDLMRRVCFIVYGCCGDAYYYGNEFLDNYLFLSRDDNGNVMASNFGSLSLDDVLNMDKGTFASEYGLFLNNAECPIDGMFGPRFDLWPARASSVTEITWSSYFSDKDQAIDYLNCVTGGLNATEKRKVRRSFGYNLEEKESPVDTEQLKTDAELLDESVQHRIDMLVDWLSSHQSLTEKYRQLHEEYDNLKKQLSISQAQRAVSGQERDEQATKDCEAIDFISKCQDEYDIAMRNLSDVMLENNNLNEQVRNLQAQLDQANSTIADLKETIAAKKASDKVKVAQDQAEEAKLKYKQLQETFDQKVTEEVVKNRDGNIKSFLDGLRQRCKNKSPEKIGFLFDDLKDSSWGFPELQKAIRELHSDLTAEPTQEERRTRAMERQADKEPTVNVKPTGDVNINNAGDTHVSGSHIGTIVDNMNLNGGN